MRTAALTIAVLLVACGAVDSECGFPAKDESDRDNRSAPVDRCNQPLSTSTNGEE